MTMGKIQLYYQERIKAQQQIDIRSMLFVVMEKQAGRLWHSSGIGLLVTV